MPDPSYDVIILGAGPAGYVCAIRAAQLGLKTALVEKEFLGGVCLNIGCIPSKALLRNAEIIQLLKTGSKEFGFEAGEIRVDYPAAVRRSRQISSRMVKGVEFLLRKNSIDVLRGRGAHSSTGRRRGIPGRWRSFLCAPRPSAKVASILFSPPARGRPSRRESSPTASRILTYREAILRETLPASAVIVGGGPIGLEFATVWNTYGVPVTVVEMLPRIAPARGRGSQRGAGKGPGQAGDGYPHRHAGPKRGSRGG